MKTENIQLMRQAKEALSGKWGTAAVVTLVYGLIIGIAQTIPFLNYGLMFLIIGPLALGYTIFVLSISRGGEAKFEQLFEGFESFGKSFVTYLLMTIFVFLWMLLLIIPGIIAAFSYAMTFFILADEPQIAPMDALRKSKQIMKGYKLKLFYLMLRFFGWAVLCIFTLGIGFLWLEPYVQVSIAKFYDDIKNDALA